MHVPIAGLVLLPLVLGMPIIFSPIHIAFLEMIIGPGLHAGLRGRDGGGGGRYAPAAAAAVGAIAILATLIFWSLLQGALVFALTAAIFVLASKRGMPADEVRALTVVSLVFCVASLILVNRSFSTSLVTAIRRPNPMLVWILAAVAAILALSLLAPPVLSLFRFGPLHGHVLVFVLGAASTVLLVLELAKTLWRDRPRF